MSRTLLSLSAATLWSIAGLGGCGRTGEPDAAPVTEPAAGAPAAPASGLQEATHPDNQKASSPVSTEKGQPGAAGRAPTDLEQLGAVSWIPEDVSYFSSVLRLKEIWTSFSKTNAYRRLMALPIVALARMQIMSHPAYQEFLLEREKNPQLRQALEVLEEAFSTEVFLYAGKRFPEFLETLSSLYGSAVILSALSDSGTGPSTEMVLHVLLENADGLHVPPVVLGFRLASRADAAMELLDSVHAQSAPSLSIPIDKQQIAGGTFYNLHLDARMLVEGGGPLAGLYKKLESQGIPREMTRRLRAFIESRKAVVSIGLRNDYLLLSIGSDTSHLEKLGQRRSLAKAPALEPIRQHLQPGLFSFTYVHERIASLQKLPVDEFVALVDMVLTEKGGDSVPAGLRKRSQKDVRELVEDINRIVPEPRPMMSASFIRQGIETYTLVSRQPMLLDSSRRLEILSRAGKAPLAVFGGRTPHLQKGYDRFAYWVKTAWSYFEEYVAPGLQGREREEYARTRRLLLPLFEEVHEIANTLLIPAIDNCEDLLVIDGGAKLGIPDSPEKLRIPRPALVIQLQDAEKFKQGCVELGKSTNRFLTRLDEEYGNMSFRLPSLSSRPHAGGTLYSLPIGLPILPEFEPHAVITRDYVVVAFWPSHSAEMLAGGAQLDNAVVDISKPAGAVSWVHLKDLSDLLFEDARIALSISFQKGTIPLQTAQLIGIHLPEIRALLGTLKTFVARVWVDGDVQVRHSWLCMEDIPE